MGLPDPPAHNDFHWPTEWHNIYIHYNVSLLGIILRFAQDA